MTIERLRLVERAERALRDIGVTGDMRVRYHGDLARLELAAEILDHWLVPERRATIHAALREVGFDRVTIDARGFRSGSLNVLGGVVAEPLVRARSGSVGGDGVSLTEALRRRGIECEVDARERLAVLRFDEWDRVESLMGREARGFMVEVARGQGFTHVAIDLGTIGDDAPVHRG